MLARAALGNGAPIRSASRRQDIHDPGATPSRGRPRVAGYNPYAESLLRTLNDCPQGQQDGFVELEVARGWGRGFLRCDGQEHRHSRLEKRRVSFFWVAYPRQEERYCTVFARLRGLRLSQARETKGVVGFARINLSFMSFSCRDEQVRIMSWIYSCRAKNLVSVVFAIYVVPVLAVDGASYWGIEFQPGLQLGYGYIKHDNQVFGGEVSTLGLPVDKDGERSEGYVEPSIAFEAKTATSGEFFGKASGVGSATRGDVDAGGFSRGDPEDFDWEDGYVGWRSGNVLPNLSQNALAISYGRQPFMVGNGFLIGDGHFDQGPEGAVLTGPRTAFDWTLIAQLDVGDFHADLFNLRGRQDFDEAGISERTTLKGANFEWRSKIHGTFGVAGFKVEDSSMDSRDGMDVYDVRASFAPFKSIPEALLSAEYAWQDNSDVDIRGRAWYLEVKRSFSDVKWTPAIAYRYSKYSQNFDSLYYGYGGDWGSWYQGEIVGEYMLFNSNQKVHMLKFDAYPLQVLRVGAVAYDISFDKTPVGVADRDFSQEINLYVDWMPTDNWTAGVLYGLAKPGDGAEQLLGDDEVSSLVQAYILYTL